MNAARAICTNRWEQVVGIETDISIFHLTPVLGKENSSCAWSITNPEYVAFFELGAARLRSERPVVRLVTVRMIANRVSIESRHTKRWVWFRCEAYCNVGGRGKIKHLYLPVVDLVQFR